MVKASFSSAIRRPPRPWARPSTGKRSSGRCPRGRADADPNPIPTAGWAYSASAASLHPYDAIAAAKSLESAGWLADPATRIRAKKGTPFKVTMGAADSYPNQQIAEAIAPQLLAGGIP